MKNAISSTARIVAMGKYLVALASCPDKPADGDISTSKDRTTSPRKRHLHILYLLNDLLHHTKYHLQSTAAYSTLSYSLESYLVELSRVASAYGPERYPNHHRKIQDLLGLWNQKDYYELSFINKLRETVANSAALGEVGSSRPANGAPEDEAIETSTGKKGAPFIMPASHGDLSTPYYDLPAGNLLPHIIPNSTVPINPQQVKPLQFVPRPADEALTRALMNFMQDVESLDMTIRNDEEGIEIDIDELGQPMIRNVETGELVRGEGYYGWSKAFCERMKRRRDGKDTIGDSTGRGDSMDRSPSLRKRRRYSSSGSSRRSYPNSRSISRSPRLRSRSRSPSRQRSSSYSPPPVVSSTQQQQPVPTQDVPPSLPPPSQASSYPLPVQFPQDHAQGFPFGSGGLPIPPPPPNYNGPWPPPPPPLPQGGGSLPQGSLLPNFPPFMPPPLSSPSGPRGFSNSGLPPLPQGLTKPQSQLPGSPAGWALQQHGVYPASAAQAPYNGHYPSGRGRGRGGGWG